MKQRTADGQTATLPSLGVTVGPDDVLEHEVLLAGFVEVDDDGKPVEDKPKRARKPAEDTPDPAVPADA